MANPVAIYATSIDPPGRRAGAGEADSGRTAARSRGAYPRLAYDSRLDPALERLRHADALREARARGQDALRRPPRFEDSLGDLEAEKNDALGETGRRRASAALSFTAQQIAQEKLSPGLHFENYKPAIAAYARAAGYGAPGHASGAALQLLV